MNQFIIFFTVSPGLYQQTSSGFLSKVKKIGGTKFFSCRFCLKQFKKPSDLIRHMRTHTNEKPFKCHHCDKSFAVKTGLKNHMKVHTGEGYKCHVTKKFFFIYFKYNCSCKVYNYTKNLKLNFN